MSDTSDKSTDQDEASRLAKEYVDLWESQFKALAGDEALAKTMAQTMELMNAGAANMATMMQRAADDMNTKGAGDVDSRSDAERVDPAKQPDTKTAGTSSGSAEPDIRELTVRIAELEKRLARLEGLTEPTGKAAPGKPRKNRS